MNKQERRTRIIARLRQGEEALSEKERDALHWVVEHAEVVEELLVEPITPEEERVFIASARQKDDQLALYIMRYKQCMDALEEPV